MDSIMRRKVKRTLRRKERIELKKIMYNYDDYDYVNYKGAKLFSRAHCGCYIARKSSKGGLIID
ncbi:hypothetical protein [Anaerocellum danielii]|uniref:Uncharacterized protein n=1 Tax=Anaerocellum danielii TaxID=1387557 RepID=A0ABZ0U368_9FIRM|nr:hypothetical protein [Caldicellulosiruptor danielii]WPX08135.1 hypothetical protein SOJ16_001999 [Caldicellulosiruptor danielii]